MNPTPDESDLSSAGQPRRDEPEGAPVRPATGAHDPFAPDPRLQVIPEVLREPDVNRTPSAERDPSGSLVSAGRAWATAFDFIFTIGAGALLGWLLDQWQSTSPWGLLGGLTLGFTTALMRIIRATLAEEKREAARRKIR